MRSRIPPEGLKSYVPFHFPYTDGDIREGLEDECGIESWNYIECEDYPLMWDINGFGGLSTYTLSQPRHLYLSRYFNDPNKGEFGFITSTNTSGIYNLNSSNDYEFEILGSFYYLGGEDVISNEAFQIILEHENEQENTVTDLKLVISAIEYNNTEYGGYWCEGGSTTYQSNIILQSNVWNLNTKESQNIKITYEDYIDSEYDEDGLNSYSRKEALKWIKPQVQLYIVIRITDNIATVYIDGQQRLRAVLPSNTVIHPSMLMLGGCAGSFSNYAFWHRARTGIPEAPTAIYPFTLNVNELGGFGTGRDGDKTLTTSTDFNCCGLVSEVTDTRTLKVNSWVGGNSGVTASKGCEIMIHVTKPRHNEVDEWPYLGMFAFRKIARLKDTTIILNRGIYEETDGFTLSQDLADNYYVQVIVVPNYKTLTLPYTIFPVKWNENECGGIVIFRTTGDCTINSHITTVTYGGFRAYDNHTMSHSTLLNRFLCSSGGGIIIICGGKLTISGCLGNPQSLPQNSSAYASGRAGHGGGYITYTSTGFGSNYTEPGKDYLKNAEKVGSNGVHSSFNSRSGGACIIIVARTAAIKDDTHMTGGGKTGTIQTGGMGYKDVGGGCGFCYMAIGELVNG